MRAFSWEGVASVRPTGRSAPGRLLLVLALLGSAGGAAAVDVWVDDDPGCSTAQTCGKNSNPPCCKIRTAICYASAGDVVMVKPGSYNEAFRMKPGVSVVSEQGPNVTTINGTGQQCTRSTDPDLYCQSGSQTCGVVMIGSAVGSDTRLEGFKLIGGRISSLW